MKLSEKICYCRKKAGISQEELAGRIGVSRQAVSKWETGDAEPELSKIKLLAGEFGVSIDWLLSDADHRTEKTEYEYNEGTNDAPSNWVESIPGVLGRLFRRFGWIGGVYAAIVGFAFMAIGGTARFISNQMLEGVGELSAFSVTPFNPVAVLGTVIMIFGAVLSAVGIVFAIILKVKSKK